MTARPDLEIVLIPGTHDNGEQPRWAIRDNMADLWRTGEPRSSQHAWSRWPQEAMRYQTPGQANQEVLRLQDAATTEAMP